MTTTITEQQGEQAALGWFEALGFDIARGAAISPGADAPLRGSHEQVVLEPRLRSALSPINPDLPDEAFEQAVGVIMRPPEPTLAQNSLWFHHLLTDSVGKSRGGRYE